MNSDVQQSLLAYNYCQSLLVAFAIDGYKGLYDEVCDLCIRKQPETPISVLDDTLIRIRPKYDHFNHEIHGDALKHCSTVPCVS